MPEEIRQGGVLARQRSPQIILTNLPAKIIEFASSGQPPLVGRQSRIGVQAIANGRAQHAKPQAVEAAGLGIAECRAELLHIGGIRSRAGRGRWRWRGVTTRGQQGNANGTGVGSAAMAYNQEGEKVTFRIPGLPRIHIVAAKADATASSTIDYILGNDVIGVSRLDRLTDEETITTTTTFRRRGAGNSGFVSREFPVNNRGPHGGTMLVMAQADRAVMRSQKVGFCIKSAWQ